MVEYFCVYRQRGVLFIEGIDSTLIRTRNVEGSYDLGLAFDNDPEFGSNILQLLENISESTWRHLKKTGGLDKMLNESNSIKMKFFLEGMYFLDF